MLRPADDPEDLRFEWFEIAPDPDYDDTTPEEEE